MVERYTPQVREPSFAATALVLGALGREVVRVRAQQVATAARARFVEAPKQAALAKVDAWLLRMATRFGIEIPS